MLLYVAHLVAQVRAWPVSGTIIASATCITEPVVDYEQTELVDSKIGSDTHQAFIGGEKQWHEIKLRCLNGISLESIYWNRNTGFLLYAWHR